ncbi:hypothetical protein LINPERPRIM_LOCUS10839, partial [Linum perenne]
MDQGSGPLGLSSSVSIAPFPEKLATIMLRLGEVSSEGSLLISTSGSASGSSSLGEALNTCREV